MIEKVLYPVAKRQAVELRLLTEPDLSSLKFKQPEFVAQIIEACYSFLDKKSETNYVILSGSAGSGKSYVMATIAQQLLWDNKEFSGFRVALSAPTNKAVKVLREKCPFHSNQLIFGTTHSLMGLVEQQTPDGNIIFKPSGRDRMTDIDVLIVDECSMLDSLLFGLLLAKTSAKFVIFAGDYKQLNPVGEEQSKVFISGFPDYRLTDIIRQSEDNPVMQLINKPTSYLFSTGRTVGTKGWTTVPLKDIEQVILPMFDTEQYRNDPNFFRVLCWTRNYVSRINTRVRKHLFGENVGAYAVGERLVMRSPFVEFDQVVLNTNDEVEIVAITEGEVNIYEKTFKTFQLKLSYYDRMNLEAYRTIPVIHPDSIKDLEDSLVLLKEMAMTFPALDHRRREYWTLYYDLKGRFADLQPAYAQTIHTAQGSTYHNVGICMSDIQKNINLPEKARLIYTGLTRPMNHVFVFK